MPRNKVIPVPIIRDTALKVRAWREGLGMTQAQFAVAVGLSRQTISGIEGQHHGLTAVAAGKMQKVINARFGKDSQLWDLWPERFRHPAVPEVLV